MHPFYLTCNIARTNNNPTHGLSEVHKFIIFNADISSAKKSSIIFRKKQYFFCYCVEFVNVSWLLPRNRFDIPVIRVLMCNCLYIFEWNLKTNGGMHFFNKRPVGL